MTYSFRTNGNFIDFVHTDNTNQMVESVLRSLHNTSRAVEWSLPEDETRINFTVDDLDYRNILITEIDFDDVAMDSQDDFQTGIEAMFPGYAGGGSPGGAVGIDDVLAEEQALTGNRIVDLDGNSLSFQHGGNDMLRITSNQNNGQNSIFRTFGGTLAGESFLAIVNNDDDGGVHKFDLSSNAGADAVRILGDAIASTLTYTADTHTFNAAGNEVAKFIDGESTISAFNDETDDGNVAYVSAEATAEEAEFNLSAIWNGADEAKIYGYSNEADGAAINYEARFHYFLGNVGIGDPPSADQSFFVNGNNGAVVFEMNKTAQTITLTAANGTILTLPTSDPAIVGALWNNAGTITISAG